MIKKELLGVKRKNKRGWEKIKMRSNPEIIILFIFLSLAFLLERKPLNLILNFVGILISLAFIISNEYPEAQFFSFILIIVYTSALSILFGFIIMLNPNNIQSYSNIIPKILIKPNNNKQLIQKTYSKKIDLNPTLPYRSVGLWSKIRDYFYNFIKINSIKNKYFFILIIFFFFFFYNFFFSNYNLLHFFSLVYKTSDSSIIHNKILTIFHSILPQLKLSYDTIVSNNVIWNSSEQEFNSISYLEVIEKLGRNIYSCPNTIINFIIAILILLLALISLFFLIL
jgi:NADH:ubiquinone oxidoreductase subunit 6 (subunit J)